MIKFFRRIRQNLLLEGKTGKPGSQTVRYLKYASGEIILVVIGILIALSINNWNESRKSSIKAQSYLLNIKEDLTNDTVFYNKAIHELNLVAPRTEFLLNLTNFSKYKFDSLVNLLPITYYEYTIYSQTYDKLINSGITDLGGDAKLFNEINDYYTSTSNYFYSVRNWDINETTKDNDYFLSNKFELPDNVNFYRSTEKKFHTVQSEEDKLSSFSEVMLSVTGRNKLRNSYHRKNRLLRAFEESRTAALELLQRIILETQ